MRPCASLATQTHLRTRAQIWGGTWLAEAAGRRATRHCKVAFPWHEICNPSTDSASEASNIDITKHETPALATRKASLRTLFKPTTPANVFATLAILQRVIKILAPRETQFEPPKTSRGLQFLTILTSKSLSRHSVVQILLALFINSKSVPNMQRGFLANRSRATAWCQVGN